jgi:hypothetical protein
VIRLWQSERRNQGRLREVSKGSTFILGGAASFDRYNQSHAHPSSSYNCMPGFC